MAAQMFFLTAVLATTACLCTAQEGIQNENLHCYYCEAEQTNACTEFADVTALTSVGCKDLDYRARMVTGNSSTAEEVLKKAVDGKFRGRPFINEIFQESVKGRAVQSFKYICMTATLTADDKKGTVRTCQKQPSDVKDPCDFVKQDLDSSIKMKSCRWCDTDNCNSSSYLNASVAALLVSALLLMAFQFI